MSAGEELRQRIADAIDRLYDAGAIYAIEDSERDAIAAELLPLFAAERTNAVRAAADDYEHSQAMKHPGTIFGTVHRIRAYDVGAWLRIRATATLGEVPR